MTVLPPKIETGNNQLQLERQNPLSEEVSLDESADIKIINQELTRVLNDSQGTIAEICSHLLNAGGKRVRPLLVLYSGLIFADFQPELLQAAVAAELVHMASLVHDDIIDESGLRRNKPSVNKTWGNQVAVLAGDYLFAKAFSVLAGNNLVRNLNLMVATIQEMCYGEIIQAEARFNFNLGLEHYYERITKKTAILLQCACKSGAVVGGASEIQIEQLGEYGLNMGFAFQIIDDILDFTGDSLVMGKPKNEDLVQGNLTLPVLLLLDHPHYGRWLRDLLTQQQFQLKDLEQVNDLLQESGIIKRTFEIAGSFIAKAKLNLSGLPQSQPLRLLMGLTEKLQSRTF